MTRDDWAETGWFVEPTGSRDLFATIGSIGGYDSHASLAWRGMSSIDFDVVTSLQRVGSNATEDTIRASERSIIEAARAWGLGFGATGWLTDLQLLADLQHYGTSTRLLDVTSNPMTALWFACQTVDRLGSASNISRDGLLLAINTAGWRRFGKGMPVGSYTAIENPLSWELNEALAADDPFVVESLVPNDRLRAQEGFFVAGRVPREGEQPRSPFRSFQISYERTSPENLRRNLSARTISTGRARQPLPFVAVSIPATLKSRVIQRLENSYNRRANVLFPDFSGFRDFSAAVSAREKSLPRRRVTE